MKEPKTYYLDLQTVLGLLRKKTGILTTRVVISGQAGTGTIVFRDGQIIQCILEWSRHRVEGEDAFARLKAIQEWQVHLEVSPQTTQLSPIMPPSEIPSTYMYPSTPIMSPPATPAARLIVPILRAPLQPNVLLSYTPQQRLILRTVYTLVDGHKTMDQIISRLSLPPATVVDALATLQQLGCITY